MATNSFFRLVPEAERARHLIMQVQMTKDQRKRAILMQELRDLMAKIRAERELVERAC